MKIVGSRRGKHLLPLWIQWPVFVTSTLVALVAVIAWIRGHADSYPHQHARMASLTVGVVLMAAAGLIRQNRGLHVALFLSGGACAILAAALR